jgi:glycosyltransferase involved in cell wall biosynthesis
MRIALLLTNRLPVPVPAGMVFASLPIHIDIATELARRGHEVTVFCADDSELPEGLTKASCGLPSTLARAKEDPATAYTYKYDVTAEQLLYSHAYERAAQGEFEIILGHDPIRAAHFSRLVTVPSLFTLHDELHRAQYQLLAHYNAYSNLQFVSISIDQREALPSLNYAATIYHGLNLGKYEFCAHPEEYVVYFGRVIKEKGVLQSLAAAKAAGLKIKLIGPMYEETGAQKQYAEEVKALVDGDTVEYLGSMSHDELIPIVARAKAMIHMVEMREPFGLSLIEAQALGTPVVARRRGSIPEIIQHGETGFVVDSVDEAAEALKNIHTIDRAACRARVEQVFTLQRCAAEYERVIQQVIESCHANS